MFSPRRAHHFLASTLRLETLFLFPLLIGSVQAAERLPSTISSSALPYQQWKNGPPGPGQVFPIAVWLQNPRQAARYKAMGINLYVGLWNGPTEAQLEELERHDMPVICSLNRYARTQLNREIIVGWMHGDEPDNAQSLGSGQGYGPPVSPGKIESDYNDLKTLDLTRPVLLNLGQGVAWDGWHGRGVRTNHPEDYPAYARGGDIVSFDIYPVVHDKPAVAGNLWYVARGVQRLKAWAGPSKVIWNCIETTHIGNPGIKPTPAQVKAEVWMSLIHGSRGIIYFSHQFKPRFIEAGILADPAMSRAIGAINTQIQALVPVLDSPTLTNALTLTATPPGISPELARAMPGTSPVATLVKQHDKAIYVMAVRMEKSPVQVSFEIKDISPITKVEVVGEDRLVQADPTGFQDDFEAHEVHIYRLTIPNP